MKAQSINAILAIVAVFLLGLVCSISSYGAGVEDPKECPPPDLTNWLITPNGGQQYTVGSVIGLTIDGALYTPAAVSIELYDGATKVWGPGTAGITGRTIPTISLPVGSNYKVKIYNTSVPSEADWSNATFSIVPGNSLYTTSGSRCGAGSVTLAANTNDASCSQTIVHKWYTSSTGGTYISGTQVSTGTCAVYRTEVTVSTTTSYWVSATINGVETARQQVTGAVNPIPGVPTAINGSRCGTGAVTLTSTPGTNANSLRWYAASTGGSPLKTGPAYTTPSISSNTTYYISSYDSVTTCESTAARVAVTATINVVPGAPSGMAGSRCGAGTVSLTATPGSNGTTVKWYAASTGGSALATNTNFTTPSIAATTTYYIASFNATTQCESTAARAPVVATIKTVPGQPSISGNVGFSNNSLTLIATGAPVGGSYEWFSPSGTSLSTSSTYITPPIAASTSTYGYVTAIDNGCPSTPLWISLTMHALPVITADKPYTVMGESVILDAGSGFLTYSWKRDGIAIAGTGQTISTNIPGSYTVTVTKSGVAGQGTSLPYNLKNGYANADLNYVVSNTILKPGVISSDIGTLSVNSLMQTVQYYDDLGRPIEGVAVQASPAAKDVVQVTAYDDFGRESAKYLPYVTNTVAGGYKSNPIGSPGTYTTSPQYSFYNDSNPIVVDDTKPYATTVYEESPLNRVLKQYGPGAGWNNNFIEKKYLTNVHGTSAGLTGEKVIAFKLDLAGNPIRCSAAASYIETGGYYSTGQLTLNVTVDEQLNSVRE